MISSKDLNIFHKKLFYNPTRLDLSDFMFGDNDTPDILSSKAYLERYKYAAGFFDKEEDAIDSIIFTIIKRLGYNFDDKMPMELVNQVLIMNNYSDDFDKYPTFYSQNIIQQIADYTICGDNMVQAEYSFEDIVKIITGDNSISLLSETRLNSGSDKLQEVFINNAGVCIIGCETIPRDILHDTLKDYSFDGENFNFKVDRRHLSGKISILDWRDDDRSTGSTEDYR